MGWIGFDFDGTLAREYTFEPIPLMMKRLRKYLDQGVECRILTARGNDSSGIALVKTWLKENNLPDLQVTSKKDYQMIVLYDDRARQVIPNQGVVVGEDDQPRKKSHPFWANSEGKKGCGICGFPADEHDPEENKIVLPNTKVVT